MRWILLSLAIAGCASAGKGNSIIGGIDDAGVRTEDGNLGRIDAAQRVDASEEVDASERIDAAAIDAPPRPLVLIQTTSTEVVDNNALACRDSTDPPRTPANSYYRVFVPGDDGITTPLHITEVAFGIQDAIAASGGVQPATMKIGKYTGTIGAGTLDLTKVTAIKSVAFMIGDASLGEQSVPIVADVPAGTNFIVELALPVSESVKHSFFIGSNDAGEHHPGYLRATECGFTAPTSFTTVASGAGTGPIDILMSVTAAP